MKATELYITVMLFITLYTVVLTLESVNEILNSDYSNKLLSCGAVYYAVKGGSNFW